MTAQPNLPNKFTGKERDTDFGLNWDYFGARLYNPDGEVVIFLVGGGGVDALPQVGANLASGQSFGAAVSNVNLTEVGISALALGLVFFNNRG